MPIDNFWAVIVAVFVGAAVLWDVLRDPLRLVRGRNVVLLGIGVWYLHQALTLSTGKAGVEQGNYDYAVLCVGMAAASFLAGYHGLPRPRIFVGAARRVSRLDDPEVLWKLVVFCSAVGFAPILYNSGLEVVELFRGITGMRRTWGGVLGRGRYGGLREALLQLEFFLRGASALGFILLLRRGTPMHRRALCAMVVGWVLIRALGGGTRSNVISACFPLAALLYFRSGLKVKRAWLALGLAAIPLLYTFMAATVMSRAQGEFRWDEAGEATYVGNEMFQELAFVTTQVPSRRDYLMGYSYYVQLVNPVPRFLWPGKPKEDTGLVMAELRGAVDSRGEATMTVSPGILGEMYFNFGFWGIALMSFLGGWIVRGWDAVREAFPASPSVAVFYAMGLATLFLLGLSITMSMFYGLLFFYVALIIVTRLFLPSGAGGPSPAGPAPLPAGVRP